MKTTQTEPATPPITQHTPGPWHVEGESLIATTDYPQHVITSLAGFNNTSRTVANARLIAAAPDLLAALQSCVDECERLCIGNVDLMRTAIAKAIGQ